jgi:hypothetical protein
MIFGNTAPSCVDSTSPYSVDPQLIRPIRFLRPLVGGISSSSMSTAVHLAHGGGNTKICDLRLLCKLRRGRIRKPEVLHAIHTVILLDWSGVDLTPKSTP